MGVKHKHRDIVGQRLRKDHLAKWDTLRFMEWFALVHHFCPKGDWEWNDLSHKTFIQQAEDRPIWEEWKHRYGMDREEKPINIGRPMMAFTRYVGEHLQSNPHSITVEMRERMKAHPTLTRYTEPFIVKETEMGKVVTADENLIMPEVQYHKSLLRLAAIANDLTEGITKEMIRKLSPDDRIKLMIQIVRTMNTVQGGQKANLNVLKQIIINNASREELEKVMLEATEDKRV